MIYICDDIQPNDEIKDDLFQLNPNKGTNNNIIYLYRECEMYQWQEMRSRISNKYSKTWRSTYIDSGTFEDIENHENPESNIISSKLFHTKHFKVSNFEFHLDENEFITDPKIPIRSLLKYAELIKNCNITLNGNKSKLRNDHERYGWYYFSNNTINTNENSKYKPQIGDIRVRFWIITQPLSLTVVGKQNGTKINLKGTENEEKTKHVESDIICMRRIGTYKFDNALKKLFHVKWINNETGSIFIMTNIALSCCIFATELLKPIVLQIKDDESDNIVGKFQKSGDLGLRALIGSTVICGPIWGLGVAYPHIENLYGKHPTLMNSIGVLTVASIVLGGTHSFSQN